ncbi:MAG: hypothetical protein ACJAS6_001353 [Rickettsiales bacterium]|jgi:hypothetical protein
MHTISLTDDTFKRLASRAVGFETPDTVIKRIMDEIEGKSKKPEIIFNPDDENEFKKQLIKTKSAEIALYNANNEREIIHWNALKFSENSNLRANLWSGHLREWKKRNIIKIELSIFPTATHKDDVNQIKETKSIALQIGLKYEEMEEMDYDKIELTSNSGNINTGYQIQFNENCSKDILDKISMLEDDNTIILAPNTFDEENYL